MIYFFQELSQRSYALHLFGWFCLPGAILCSFMIVISDTQVLGINAWIKPLKFYLSTIFYVWTMGWFLGDLPQENVKTAYEWTTILVLGFELLYINFQAAMGELSHFNTSSTFHSSMFSIMGVAISISTLFTLYIGILYFKGSFPQLPPAYLWAVRLSIVIFVIFAFEGGMMGAQLSHTVGAADGGPGLKLLNWSVTHGDLRIAHFIGMHALQVLPLLGYFVITNHKAIIGLSAFYFLLAVGVLVQALMKLPLIKIPV